MKPAAPPSKAGLSIAAVIVLSYLAGYGIIRKGCLPMGGPWLLVPDYLVTNPTLSLLYRPCFWLETRISGNQFTFTP